MSYDIITDPGKELSVLVDAELGRALGPVASGPNAEQVLEAFVGALGVDPSLLQHWEISFRWSQYLEALIGDVQHEHAPPADEGPEPWSEDHATAAEAAAAGDPVAQEATANPPAAESVVPTEPAVEPSSGSDTTSTPEPIAGAAVAEATAAASGGEPPAPAPADVDPTSSESPTPAGESSTPPAGITGGSGSEPVRATVPAGEVTCPQCEGWRTIAENGQVVDCPLCGASGAVSPDVADGYSGGIAAG